MHNRFLLLGALLAALAVVLGAFGAHTLRGELSEAELMTFETAVRYQMYHALALVIVALLAKHDHHTRIRLAGYFFAAGVLVFSGSLYLLLLSGSGWWGAVTPFGGAGFIAGWFVLAWHGLRRDRRNRRVQHGG